MSNRGGRGGGGGGGRGGGGGGGGRGGGSGGGGRGRPAPTAHHLVTNMFALVPDAVQKLANKIHRYDLCVLDSRRKPKEGEEPRDTTPNKPAKMPKTAIRGIALAMIEKLNIPVISDGVAIVFTLQELEPLLLKFGATAVTLSPDAIAERFGRIKLTTDARVFDVERNDRIYTVQLQKVPWNPADKLEKTQMLQIALQFSFFVDAIKSGRTVVINARSVFMGDRMQPFSEHSELMLLSGIFQSFRFNAAGQPMLNIDMCYLAALRSDMSIYDFLQTAAGRTGLHDALKNKEFVKFANESLSGRLVTTRYGAPTTYRLDKIDIGVTPDTAKFEITEKKVKSMTTVGAYMAKKNCSIRDPKTPLVIAKMTPKVVPAADKKAKSSGASKNETPTWLVPEFLQFALGEQRKKDLTARERSDMIALTRDDPEARFAKIDNNAKDIAANAFWKQFSIDIKNKIEVDVPVLATPELYYRDKTAPIKPAEGEWNLEGLKLFEVPTEKLAWGVVYPKRLYNDTDKFVPNFIEMANSAGLDIAPQPEYGELQSTDAHEYVSCLEEMSRNGAIKFFIVVLPDKDNVRYGLIKDVANTRIGIATQCVVLEPNAKIPKCTNKSVLANIVAGVNPKLRCVNHAVHPQALANALKKLNIKQTLVFGLDVFHGDTSDPDNKKSVVALCMASNTELTKYQTCLRTQNARQEIVSGIASMVEEVMMSYINAKRPPPAHVLFYRDGVGEGMYERVLKEEVAEFRRSMGVICTERYKVDPPKITYIIVQKRHHLRSRATTNSYKGNPYPGTLIANKEVVDDGRPNFYLYSHKALAGTARPTHYQILVDDHALGVNEVAEFTFLLAHLHQGCTKSVSLPAPVFFADRAAGCAGSCYRNHVGDLKESLKPTLFMI